ncbi:type II secretion system GspH family protein [Patescibacteria group bacterium]|nr:type II secretion system GspH family protein [Patescibacteria group bacterium]MBU1256866.1 type II secretion system GspH family protein [Patescibacteria group bacterium]MBU1457493.1 type II secretion system GspH family protein [Patescibacteria group bacterium]
MKNKKGFTLLELLVVIGIIAILVSLATVAYTSAQKKSRDSRRQADLKAVQSALEVYYSEHSYVYPTTCSSAGAYLKSAWPVDPVGVAPYIYSDAAGKCLVASYCICAKLEVAGKGNASNTTCSWGGDKTYYCVGNLQ